MNQHELDEALLLHKMWLNNEGGKRADLRGADLRGADLTDANLRGANLRGADLREADVDFSCLPLWCGGAHFRADMRLVRQLLAHVATIKCDDPAWPELQAAILPEAKKSHRAGDLGLLNKETKGENK